MSIYAGAYLDYGAAGPSYNGSQAYAGSALQTFETSAKKNCAIVHFGYQTMSNGSGTGVSATGLRAFPTTNMNNIWSRGSIPMLNLGTWDISNHANDINWQWSNIVSGMWDAFFTQWFTDAKAWKHPFLLRLDHEFNFSAQTNPQFPWSIATMSNWLGTGTSWTNTLANYIAGWQHIHDIRDSVGATNVAFVWCPNIKSPNNNHTTGGTGYYSYAEMYPGDKYVEHWGLDGYMNISNFSTYNQFKDIYTGTVGGLANSYAEITAVCGKGGYICECSADDRTIGQKTISYTPDDTIKGNWFTNLLQTDLKATFPQVLGWVIFNTDYAPAAWVPGTADSNNHWPIEQPGSGGATLRGYTTNYQLGIGSPYYHAGGTLNGVMPPDLYPCIPYAAIPQQSAFRQAIRNAYPSNLVGWWANNPTSGTVVTDLSSGARNGTLSGGFTLNQQKVGAGVLQLIDPAILFDGINGQVSIADNDAFSIITTGKLSLVIAFRIASVPTANVHVVSKGAASNFEYSFQLTTNGWQVSIYQLGGTSYTSFQNTAGAISTNVDHLMVISIDTTLTTGVINAWIDGTIFTSTTKAGSIANGTAPLQFGRRADNPASGAFAGTLGHVAMWNVAFTPQDASEINAAFGKRRRHG